jgi:hypothetical protein
MAEKVGLDGHGIDGLVVLTVIQVGSHSYLVSSAVSLLMCNNFMDSKINCGENFMELDLG